MTEKQVVFLKGKKTILRPVDKDDIPNLVRWINDPEVRQFIKNIYPQTVSDEEKWFEDLSKKKPQNAVFTITTLDGTPIGVMGIHDISGVHGTATTGALIGDKDYWGKGYGSDAKMVLLDHAFNVLNLRKIYSRVIGFNERSVAYSRKCGYKVEAVLKDHFFRFGKYWDEFILSVTREEFAPVLEQYNKE